MIEGYLRVGPYITSVGATEVYPGKTIHDPEGASNTVIFSGGGFSNFFSMPTYQSGAIAHYYEKHNPPYTAAQYNNSRKARGFPDMAANGVNCVYQCWDPPRVILQLTHHSPE